MFCADALSRLEIVISAISIPAREKVFQFIRLLIALLARDISAVRTTAACCAGVAQRGKRIRREVEPGATLDVQSSPRNE